MIDVVVNLLDFLIGLPKPLAALMIYPYPLDGIVAGTALITGFVTFWISPEIVLVPFLGFISDWQMSYLFY